ncbi:hypothetical protein [Paenibacillus caseinilyticus]|uniref:hypothetical protein n=1 Tax=Paenibacillus caseinilyticus TaxID=3098138 RepID=UPI0022B8CA5F|nr:hypothetical protein [Paenibacillus caseinilyticus]MCZ8520778.1 hypothetical protein [Paenibacillus caseinilyticus]
MMSAVIRIEKEIQLGTIMIYGRIVNLDIKLTMEDDGIGMEEETTTPKIRFVHVNGT